MGHQPLKSLLLLWPHNMWYTRILGSTRNRITMPRPTTKYNTYIRLEYKIPRQVRELTSQSWCGFIVSDFSTDTQLLYRDMGSLGDITRICGIFSFCDLRKINLYLVVDPGHKDGHHEYCDHWSREESRDGHDNGQDVCRGQCDSIRRDHNYCSESKAWKYNIYITAEAVRLCLFPYSEFCLIVLLWSVSSWETILPRSRKGSLRKVR